MQTATEMTINHRQLLDLLNEIAQYDQVKRDAALAQKIDDARRIAVDVGAAIEPLLEDNKDLAYRYYQISQNHNDAPISVSDDVKRYQTVVSAGGTPQLIARIIRADYPDDPVHRLKILRSLFDLDLQSAKDLDDAAANA